MKLQKSISDLLEIANDYIMKATYPSEAGEINNKIYELCWFYLLGAACQVEIEILKDFFEIN